MSKADKQNDITKIPVFEVGTPWNDIVRAQKKSSGHVSDDDQTEIKTEQFNPLFMHYPMDEVFEGFECIHLVEREDGEIVQCGALLRRGFVGDHFKLVHQLETDVPTFTELTALLVEKLSKKASERKFDTFTLVKRRDDDNSSSNKNRNRDRHHSNSHKIRKSSSSPNANEIYTKSPLANLENSEIQDSSISNSFPHVEMDVKPTRSKSHKKHSSRHSKKSRKQCKNDEDTVLADDRHSVEAYSRNYDHKRMRETGDDTNDHVTSESDKVEVKNVFYNNQSDAVLDVTNTNNVIDENRDMTTADDEAFDSNSSSNIFVNNLSTDALYKILSDNECQSNSNVNVDDSCQVAANHALHDTSKSSKTSYVKTEPIDDVQAEPESKYLITNDTKSEKHFVDFTTSKDFEVKSEPMDSLFTSTNCDTNMVFKNPMLGKKGYLANALRLRNKRRIAQTYSASNAIYNIIIEHSIARSRFN